MLCNVLSKMVEIFVLLSSQWLSVVVSIGVPCWLNMASSELQFAKNLFVQRAYGVGRGAPKANFTNCGNCMPWLPRCW
jgi:hypothetical protein